jgi:hypothetical protein
MGYMSREEKVLMLRCIANFKSTVLDAEIKGPPRGED